MKVLRVDTGNPICFNIVYDVSHSWYICPYYKMFCVPLNRRVRETNHCYISALGKTKINVNINININILVVRDLI